MSHPKKFRTPIHRMHDLVSPNQFCNLESAYKSLEANNQFVCGLGEGLVFVRKVVARKYVAYV